MATQTLNEFVVEWSKTINEMSTAQRKIFIANMIGAIAGLAYTGDKKAEEILRGSLKQSEKWK